MRIIPRPFDVERELAFRRLVAGRLALPLAVLAALGAGAYLLFALWSLLYMTRFQSENILANLLCAALLAAGAVIAFGRRIDTGLLGQALVILLMAAEGAFAVLGDEGDLPEPIDATYLMIAAALISVTSRQCLWTIAIGIAAMLAVARPWQVPERQIAYYGTYLAISAMLALALSLMIEHQRRREFELTERLDREAMRDAETGLFNRRGFQELAQREHDRACRYPCCCSILTIAIDQPRIPGRNGERQRVLELVARTTERQLRSVDLLGRWEDDRFLALLPETPPDVAIPVASRLATALGRLPEATITVSIGIAALNTASDGLAGAIARAFAALSLAQSEGGNRVERAPDP